MLDLLADPGEMDAAAFIGTDQDDQFEINLGAAGTNADPVLQLFEPGGTVPLLSLRDYRNFGTLGIDGRDGADVFNIYVALTGPGTGHRNLLIDGGLPSGPGNSKDRLTVFWQGETPAPPPADPPPSAGSPVVETTDQFFVDYDPLHQFTIDFIDVEQAKSANANANG